MSFFFEIIAIPFWFIVFVFASASPLWFSWYKRFHKKFIATGALKNNFFSRKKSDTEMMGDVLKKATEHANAKGNTFGSSGGKDKKRTINASEADTVKKKNIREVLTVLAAAGEPGILPRSISDKTKINSIDTTGALTYLAEKNYAEVINSTNGTKYYLTDLGRRYCINKRYIS